MLIEPVGEKTGWFAEFECSKCGKKRRVWFFREGTFKLARKDKARSECDWYREECEEQVKKAG